MQEDRGRDYMNARRVAKEYEVVTKGLNRNAASVPPQNNPDEVKQVLSYLSHHDTLSIKDFGHMWPELGGDCISVTNFKYFT